MVSSVGTSFFVTLPAYSALGDFTLHRPIFAMRGGEEPLPVGMTLPPMHSAGGMAQLFADGSSAGGPSAGIRRNLLSSAPLDEPSAHPKDGPRFPTPLSAKKYVEHGWALYWRAQGDGIREGVIREIRGVAESDIDLLVSAWEGREPFAYDAVFGFALAGHRYARQKFVEEMLKKARTVDGDPVDIIKENIVHSLQRVWAIRDDEEEHHNMYYVVRGLVLVLCSMASDGDKGALRAVNFYLATLFELAGQLRGQPEKNRRVSMAISEADTFLKETKYLLSEVDPNKFLDDPVGNRDKLDFLASNGNMRVLEAYAHYAMRGDMPAVLTVLNTALAGSNPVIFDLLMDAAMKRPCILLFMFEYEESGLRGFFADLHRHIHGGARDEPFSVGEIHRHIMSKLRGFDFSGVSFDCENPAHMFETTVLMAFLGNRSAIGRAVELTGRLIAHGGAHAFKDNGARFLRAPLIHIIEAAGGGCAQAGELIKNLAALGHEGAKQYVANGRKPDKALS